MTTKQVVLTLDSSFFEALKKKSVQNGFKNLQQYVCDVLHHTTYGKKHAGGRSRRKDPESEYLDKFSQPTKETYKIERSVGLR